MKRYIKEMNFERVFYLNRFLVKVDEPFWEETDLCRLYDSSEKYLVGFLTFTNNKPQSHY